MGYSRKGPYIQRARVTRSLLKRQQVVLGDWNVIVDPRGLVEVVLVFHHNATNWGQERHWEGLVK